VTASIYGIYCLLSPTDSVPKLHERRPDGRRCIYTVPQFIISLLRGLGNVSHHRSNGNILSVILVVWVSYAFTSKCNRAVSHPTNYENKLLRQMALSSRWRLRWKALRICRWQMRTYLDVSGQDHDWKHGNVWFLLSHRSDSILFTKYCISLKKQWFLKSNIDMSESVPGRYFDGGNERRFLPGFVAPSYQGQGRTASPFHA
jgi:hypothetical protein